jgi:hypothetical protein
MTTPTQEDIIRMAREAGLWPAVTDTFPKELKAFANLVAAAEQKKWEDQTAIEIHEAILDERERIIKVIGSMGTWAHINEVIDEVRKNT